MGRASPMWGLFLLCGFIRFMTEVASFCQPLLLNQLMRFIADKPTAFADAGEHSPAEGYLLAGGMLVAAATQSLCLQHFIALCFELGAAAKSTLNHIVFAKMLRLEATAIQDLTTGQLTNLMTKDSAKVQEFILFVHNVWSAPLTASWVILLLISILGWPAAAGIVLTVVLIPVQSRIASKVQAYRKETLKHADARLLLIGSMLQGIRLIKLSAWEADVATKVSELRGKELATIRKSALLFAFNHTLMAAGPILVAAVTFGIRTWSGAPMYADEAFTALALFNLLGHPFSVLPKTISLLAEMKTTLSRLETLFSLPDRPPMLLLSPLPGQGASVSTKALAVGYPVEASVTLPTTGGKGDKKGDTKEKKGEMRKVTPVFKSVLDGVEISAKQGELVLIVGTVGAGKSSLLAALVVEAPVTGGAVELRGTRVAYLPQVPWVKNGTVLENILLHAPLDQEKLDQVIHDTGLDQDLAIWNKGVDTVVGERGITLSGGQRQRVALARTLYAQCDVLLLDCPLAALDALTARHVFEEAILRRVRAKEVVVIMATNAGWMLGEADRLVLLENGRCTVGTVEEMSARGVDLRSVAPPTASEDALDRPEQKESKPAGADKKGPKPKPGAITAGKNVGKGGGASLKAEKRDVGKVSWKVYRDYVAATGALMAATLGFSALAAQGLSVGKDFVLASWSRASEADDSSAMVEFFGFYVLACVGTIILQGVRSGSMAVACLTAARRLHDSMLHSVLAAPLSFFEQTPAGHITSRFSSDVDALDFALPSAISMMLDMVVVLFGCVFVLVSQAPALLAAFFILAVVYSRVQRMFNRTATELKRMDSITKSPVFSLFAQAVDGVQTLRSMQQEEQVIEAMTSAIDANTGTYLSWAHSNRWLGVRLDLMGAILIFLAALLAVLSPTVGAGGAGLLLTYAITITRTLAGSVRTSTAMEVQFNAVERVKHFSDLDSEPELEPGCKEQEVPQEWPSVGEIEWTNVVCRYSRDDPTVINGVSLKVPAGTAVGLCGRTGAGKSSMLMALLRVLSCSSGKVTIDGVDVGAVPLQRLRSSICIIPQDPVLISRTVREAIDPLDACSTSSLEQVMETVGLRGKHAAAAGNISLDLALKEGGGNLSVGQRQLLCLARALIADKRLLVLDEATAHVDEETAERLRAAVLAMRGRCTVVVIAHRVEDLAACDTVAVMEAGQIVQHGAPAALLRETGGVFARLAEELGQGVLERVRAAANAPR